MLKLVFGLQCLLSFILLYGHGQRSAFERSKVEVKVWVKCLACIAVNIRGWALPSAAKSNTSNQKVSSKEESLPVVCLCVCNEGADAVNRLSISFLLLGHSIQNFGIESDLPLLTPNT